MKQFLCVPCAEQMKSTYQVTEVAAVHNKETCECCNRRRYCGTYIVEKKEK